MNSIFFFFQYIKKNSILITFRLILLGAILNSTTTTTTNPTTNGQVQLYQTKQINNFKLANGQTIPASSGSIKSLEKVMNEANEVMAELGQTGFPFDSPFPFPEPMIFF